MRRNVRAVLAGHLVYLAGLFLVAWGIASIGGQVSAVAVFKQPLFYGLFVASMAMHPLLGLGHNKGAAEPVKTCPQAVRP